MNFKVKFSILNQVYHIYQQSVQDFNFACKIKCARCCTRNVTLTGLEAEDIIEYMRRTRKLDLLNRVVADVDLVRYQPQLTTNQFANMCAGGEDPAEDDANEYQWAPCPLLENDECQIYAVRPFGCRCFFSDDDCRESGYASIDPFMITINNLFLQYIELIDADGRSGNLTDMLLNSVSKEDEAGCRNLANVNKENLSTIPNHKMEVLMIPPEHRNRVEPIVAQLRQIKV